jgi:hypothetical protein
MSTMIRASWSLDEPSRISKAVRIRLESGGDDFDGRGLGLNIARAADGCTTKDVSTAERARLQDCQETLKARGYD